MKREAWNIKAARWGVLLSLVIWLPMLVVPYVAAIELTSEDQARLKASFDEMDRNDDERIALIEAIQAGWPKSLYLERDLNEDGAMTFDEWIELRKQYLLEHPEEIAPGQAYRKSGNAKKN